MIDTIKKTVLAGLGAAVATAEKVQDGLDELVRDGKITGAEARAVAERIAGEGKREFQKASANLGQKVREVLNHTDSQISRRISQLEARIAHLETAKRPGTKTGARRRKPHAAGSRK